MRTPDDFESAIRRDPAQRGLIASEPHFGPVCPGQFAQAATDLAQSASRVAIVTGFYIPRGEPPAAETDGPPGALILARTLLELGVECCVITDALCFSAVQAAAVSNCFPVENLLCYPYPHAPEADPAQTALWCRDFWDHGWGRGLSHLIAIERVGPSHTPDSLERQSRSGTAPRDSFLARVPPEHRNRCHNMRGEIINAYAGDLHRLFEECAVQAPQAKTIGIGDGANEIGMGAATWEDLVRRLSGEHAGWIPCRIATDWNIVAGTSNWGGFALAAAVAALRDRVDILEPLTAEQAYQVLQDMVTHGPAVDGVTRRREPTVDGLPFATYIQPWETIRARLGLPE